tara:strand:- start:30 stop:554 length:525 start_codon:yes stop_codon:yes gene_type:complete
MKHLVKFIVVTFLVLFCTNIQAEEKIAVIDMKFILNKSKAGIGAQNFLKKQFEANEKKFAKIEKKLKNQESDLLTKKTILSKEDYTKEAIKLREEVSKYQAERRASLEKISKLRIDAKSMLLKKFDPIVRKYVADNNISLVLDNKIVILGDDTKDITKTIVEVLNKEVPSINLK